MIKSAFIYGSYTQSKQKVFHKEPYKPDFTSLSQQQQQHKSPSNSTLDTCTVTTPLAPLTSLLSSSPLLPSSLPPHSNDINAAATTTPSIYSTSPSPSSPPTIRAHSISPHQQQQQQYSTLNTSTASSIDDEVTDSEEEEEEDMGRVEEILSSDEGGVDDLGPTSGRFITSANTTTTTIGDSTTFDYDSFDDMVGEEEQEIVDSYNERVENTRQERDKLADKMLSLFMDSEIKYNLGKFTDCYNDCVKAEEIGRHIDSHPIYIAQAVLVQAKAKFKLGESKLAQQLLQSSIAIFNAFLEGKDTQTTSANTNPNEIKAWEEACIQLKSEAENLLKEVEKMCFFESLIDFSFSNPVYQQQYTLALQYAGFDDGLSLVPQRSRVDSPKTAIMRLTAPKMITQQKFESSKSKNSWQNTYLLYHRKQQGAHSACMTVKS